MLLRARFAPLRPPSSLPALAAWALTALLLATPLRAQAPPDPTDRRAAVPEFPTARALTDSLGRLAALPDAARRAAALDALWSRLAGAGQAPFAAGDTVVWLFRGSANAVAWAGDMTGWQPRAAGQRLAGTDLWWRADRLPADARVDYKVVVNGADWRLDPANPAVAWSGFGPNSELRMPAYRFATETVRRDAVARGALGPPVRTASAALGYAIQHRVYTPPGYPLGRRLPVLYVTDGHEYAPDHLGALVTTLDNAIADGRVAPLVVVFVDPRDPANLGVNRRQRELVPPGGAVRDGQADRFLAYLTGELVPAVDAAFETDPAPAARGILGTSLGGLFAAYAGAERPGVFGRVAIQSPAFWAYTPIYDRYDAPAANDPARAAQRFTLSQGTIGDGDGGVQLRGRFERGGYTFAYAERNEGHSWGQWRALVPSVLRTLFPGVAASSTGRAEAPGRFGLRGSPNPLAAGSTLRYTLDAPGHVRLTVYDVMGREVATIVNGERTAGEHEGALDARAFASGHYFAHLESGGRHATVSLVVRP